MDKKVVAILLPLSWELVSKHFLLSIVGMSLEAERNGLHCNLIQCSQGFTDENREILTAVALRQKSDYLFHLDADQTYPHDTIYRFVSWLEANDKDVIGGLTPIRTNPNLSLTFRFGEEGEKLWNPTNVPSMTGVRKVDGMGFGGIMTTARVYEKLEQPYFIKRMTDERGRKFGEDVQFYFQCRQKGIEVYCDTDCLNGHIITGIVLPEVPSA